MRASCLTYRLHLVTLTTLIAAGCVSPNTIDRERVEADVRAVLATQVATWNAGDIEGFMRTYWKSDALRFASGGSVREGWDATRDRYLTTYGDTTAMGTLRFEIRSIDVLGPDAAVVFGEWYLKREAGDLSGLYTLVLKKRADGWVICHDHTSTARS